MEVVKRLSHRSDGEEVRKARLGRGVFLYSRFLPLQVFQMTDSMKVKFDAMNIYVQVILVRLGAAAPGCVQCEIPQSLKKLENRTQLQPPHIHLQS